MSKILIHIIFFLSLNVNDSNNVYYNDIPAPRLDILTQAIKEFNKLDSLGLVKNKKLTIIDYNLSSNQKRLWVIDMNLKKVLLHTWVAHGKNSGKEYATDFSNKISSYKTSLGVFLTNETYKGGNGLSLYLDGLDPLLNNNARKRMVVIHGAKYVNKKTINKIGYLGRSLGCPAVSYEVSNKLINMIKNGSVVYSYHNTLNNN